MNQWIMLAVATSQIVVLYFITSKRYLRLIDHTFFSRNPRWLDDNPDLKQTPASLLCVFHAVGAAWLAYAAYCITNPLVPHLVLLSTIPTLAWVAMTGAYCAFQYRRVYRKIPAQARRSAPFARRALRDFVRPVWSWTCAALYASAAATYIGAYHLDTIDEPTFIGRMAGIGFIAITATACLFYGVRRKQQPIDDAFGPTYRKVEVVGALGTAYLCLIVVASVMLQDFAGYVAFDMRNFFTACNVAMQVLSLAFVSSTRVKRMTGDCLPIAAAS